MKNKKWYTVLAMFIFTCAFIALSLYCFFTGYNISGFFLCFSSGFMLANTLHSAYPLIMNIKDNSAKDFYMGNTEIKK